ncbi:putative gustatory receptor 28b isoform X3 [Zeugodacus cucurbitae]|uniref:putative gustatory receptor 28b isoform X3 n=1 Tax=Zeugodacus cucurbitae TaxID=28588 RepID=UPI0023D937CF|nr:putative gustatory receptor 28b isoform X3 [Zeugodacus cucurbitae]
MLVVRRKFANLLSADDYYKSIQPLFFFTHLIGITSCVVVSNESGFKSLAFSQLSHFVVIFVLTSFAYCCAYIVYYKATFIGHFLNTDITNGGEKAIVLASGTTAVIILITNTLRRRRLLCAFEYFPKIDKSFERIGIHWNYSRVLRNVICRLIFTGFILVIMLIIYVGCWSRLNAYPSWQLIFITFFQLTGIYFTVLLFGFLMLSTRVRIKALHKVLKNLAHQWDNSIVKPMPKQRSLQCLDSFSMYTIVTNNPCEIIQESMEIHHMICDAASTANKYFTYQLLTIISIAFLIIVFDAYYVLETLLGKSAHESKFKTVEFVTFFSCQMILYLIAIISIVEGSNRAIKKSEKTGGIVHSLLNKAKNAELKEKLQQFSLQLLHLKIHFTAAGLFNIDRTLYFTISGALTTYLIILLQFTSNNEPEQQLTTMGPNGTTPLQNLVSNLTADA